MLSATTGISPFFINKGHHLNINIYPEYNIAFSHVCDFAINLKKFQSILKSEIFTMQQQYQLPSNIYKLSALDFQLRQQVFIKAWYFYIT